MKIYNIIVNKEMSHLMENISIFIIQNFSIKESFILSKNF